MKNSLSSQIYYTWLEAKVRHENSSGTAENKGVQSTWTQWKNAALQFYTVTSQNIYVWWVTNFFSNSKKQDFLGSL
jgi:hypothetical protein